MIEQAIVREIHGENVLLECMDHACEACSSAFCSPKARTFSAYNGDRIDIQTGDRVEVTIPTGRAIRASFVALMLPVLCLAGAYLLLQRLFPGAAEALHVLGSFGGLVLGFGISYLISRAAGPKDMPLIVSKNASFEIPPFIQERIDYDGQ